MSKGKTIPCKEWIGKDSNKRIIEQLHKYSAVMSDSNKLRILFLLEQYNKHNDNKHEKLYVSDLAEHLDMSLSAVSHSLRHLQDSGYIEKAKEGRLARYFLTKAGQTLVTYSYQLKP